MSAQVNIIDGIIIVVVLLLDLLNEQQFWSAYAPCSSQHLDAVQLTLEQIDLIRRLVNLYPHQMSLVTTASGKCLVAPEYLTAVVVLSQWRDITKAHNAFILPSS